MNRSQLLNGFKQFILISIKKVRESIQDMLYNILNGLFLILMYPIIPWVVSKTKHLTEPDQIRNNLVINLAYGQIDDNFLFSCNRSIF